MLPFSLFVNTEDAALFELTLFDAYIQHELQVMAGQLIRTVWALTVADSCRAERQIKTCSVS